MSLRIPESTPTLQLKRVLLRPFCDADVAGRQRLGRDPEIQRGFGANPSYDQWQPMDHAAATAWYEQQLGYDGPFVWAVELDDRLIGTCRLRSVGPDRTDERARYSIGLLDRDLLDHGIGTTVTKGVVDYAFSAVGFHRIDLRVLASNQRAVACYQKCGFVIEGRERESAKIGDHREDDLLMGVLATDLRSHGADLPRLFSPTEPGPMVASKGAGAKTRRAERGDTAALFELWSRLSADGRRADQRYEVADHAPATMRTVVSEWIEGPHATWVAVIDDEIVGFVVASPSSPHRILHLPPTLLITDAYVVESHRRRGVGRQLVEAVLELAGETGVERIEVGTLANDGRAVGFWRSLGFGDWRVSLSLDLPPG